LPRLGLQGTYNVLHSHIHAFSFKTVKKQKSPIFTESCGWQCQPDNADKHELSLYHARIIKEEFLRWSWNEAYIIIKRNAEKGAPKVAAKNVTRCFYSPLVITSG